MYRYWILPVAKVAPATRGIFSYKQNKQREPTAAEGTTATVAPTPNSVMWVRTEHRIASRITKTENKTIYHWMQTEIPSTWTDLMVLQFRLLLLLLFRSSCCSAWFMCRFAYIVSPPHHPHPCLSLALLSSTLMFMLVLVGLDGCLDRVRIDSRETCVIDFYPALCYCWRFDFSFCHSIEAIYRTVG